MTNSIANMYVYGFTGDIGGEILKELSARNINIVACASDQVFCSDNIWNILMGTLPITSKKIDSLNLYNEFYKKYFLQYIVMNTRRGLYWKDIHELKNEFSITFHYFHEILVTQEIDWVLFSNLPHEGPDFILYKLARCLKLRTLMCHQSIFSNRFFVTTKISEFGMFKTIPSVCEAKVSISPGFKQYHCNMKSTENNINVRKKSFLHKIFNFLMVFSNMVIKKTYNVLFGKIKKPFFKNAYLKIIDLVLNFNYAIRLNKISISSHDLEDIFRKQKYIIYFPLHLQPELTTSTLGGLYDDQLLAIEKLSSKIGKDGLILIKENPKQTFFQRGRDFFRRLKCLDNVLVVDKYYSTLDLIERSTITATISGSAGWETIKGGKKCLIFGRAWYMGLPGCYPYYDEMDLQKVFEDNNKNKDFEYLCQSVDSLMKKAPIGVVDYDYSEIVDDFNIKENAKKVSDSLYVVLQSLANKL
jgi:hypothetical protein